IGAVALLLLSVGETLFALADSFRHTISAKRVCCIFQLARCSFLPFSLSKAASSFINVLLETVDAVSQCIFSFGQLLSRSLRISILTVLSAATREILHFFRDL